MEKLSANQQALKDQVTEYVDLYIRPKARELDSACLFPAEIFEQCGERGFLSAAYPRKYGGGGLGYTEAVICLEGLSKGLGSLGLIVCAHAFQCCRILLEGGSEEIKDSVLRSALAGKMLLSLGLTEESGGSDALGISTVAIRDGDSWLISGSKCWITSAGDADAHIIAAKTSPSGGNKGISLFLVNKDSPGLTVERIAGQHGMNSSPTANILLENCRVSADSLIGVENDGYALIKSALNGGRLGISAASIGIAQEALERALSYSSSRSHFGRPISLYQGISFMISDMYTDIVLARSLQSRVIALMEESLPYTTDLAALKYHSSEMCVRACQNTLQIFGGNGFNKEYEVERLLRDSRMLTIGEGTSQICKVIISNALYNSPIEKYR